MENEKLKEMFQEEHLSRLNSKKFWNYNYPKELIKIADKYKEENYIIYAIKNLLETELDIKCKVDGWKINGVAISDIKIDDFCFSTKKQRIDDSG